MPAVEVRTCYQFFGLGHKQSPKQVGIDGLKGASHPDIKEIGEVSVINIIIIRRVG